MRTLDWAALEERLAGQTKGRQAIQPLDAGADSSLRGYIWHSDQLEGHRNVILTGPVILYTHLYGP